MSKREIRRGGLHSKRVILSHIRRTLRAIVSHEQRTTIDVEIRTQLLDCRLVNLMTIERAANRLRDAVSHGLTLGLLGQGCLALTQHFFRMLKLGEITSDSLHADGLAVAEDQTRADFESKSFTLFRNNVDLVNGRNTLARLLRDHLTREV